MYDFQGMNARLQSFRQLEPSEGHQVRALSWSPTADRFLCVTGSATAKVYILFITYIYFTLRQLMIWAQLRFVFHEFQIYDRDGLTLGEFVKGDMYIRDLKNTKGHITGLTCGEWNPRAKETIMTSSEDGSLRIWDVNDFKSQKQVCLLYILAYLQFVLSKIIPRFSPFVITLIGLTGFHSLRFFRSH